MNKILPDREYEDFAFGFFLRKYTISDFDINELLSSSRAWEIFAGIRFSCEMNNFNFLQRLPRLMKEHNGYLFWTAASYLAGCAGSWKYIAGLCASLESQIEQPHIRYFMASILALSCDARAVEYLLRLHEHSDDADTRYYIENQISFLVEPNNGPLFFGADDGGLDMAVTPPQYVNREEYFERVRDALADTLGRLRSPAMAIFEGEALDIGGLAKRIRERLQGENEGRVRIEQEKYIFEAAAGVDCKCFFGDKGELRRLEAAAVIEDFLERPDAKRFLIGQRYFFGHPIPD